MSNKTKSQARTGTVNPDAPLMEETKSALVAEPHVSGQYSKGNGKPPPNGIRSGQGRDGSKPLDSALQTALQQNVLPTPIADLFDNVEVLIGYSGLFSDYTEELYNQYSYEFEIGRQLKFSVDELHRYMKMILSQRVLYVNGGRCKVRYDGAHNIPAMFSCILEMIGVCRESSMGIKLIPTIGSGLSGEDLSDDDLDFLSRISNLLGPLKKFGFVFSMGVPRGKDGDYEFMSFEVIDGMVRHYRDDNPQAYAVAAAMTNLIGLGTFFHKVVYRVNYGNVASMSHYAQKLAQSRVV